MARLVKLLHLPWVKKDGNGQFTSQFVTSSTADMKGQKYSDLVDYADNSKNSDSIMSP